MSMFERSQKPQLLSQEFLRSLRERHAANPLVGELRPLAKQFTECSLGFLFPEFLTCRVDSSSSFEGELDHLAELLGKLGDRLRVAAPIDAFIGRLEEVHGLLMGDATTTFNEDPAARSLDEVLLTYPGFLAIAHYRLANVLHVNGMPVLPRLITEIAHERTGIDIHPGATIGPDFCIDHGTGIVIGETAQLGRQVKLYQGVTLGALNVDKSLANAKRHPTIEDRVVVYANATILGGKTVVGHDTLVGGNVFLTRTVPPNSWVTRTSEVRPRGTLGAETAFDFVI